MVKAKLYKILLEKLGFASSFHSTYPISVYTYRIFLDQYIVYLSFFPKGVYYVFHNLS